VDESNEGAPLAKRTRRRSAGWGARPWSVAACLLALSASLVLLFAPLGTQLEATAVPEAGSSGQAGPSEGEVTHPSLVEIQGWGVALPLSIPLFLTGVGVIAARLGARRVPTAMAFLVGAFVVVGALSVGIYYVPAEAALIVAAAKERRE
jgi:hypothetical protein